MNKEPWFWRESSIAAQTAVTLLTPAALIYRLGSSLRQKHTTPWWAPVPVICIGNATVGGVGKTPFAIMLARMLLARGIKPHFLSRGYGGAERGPIQVDRQKHFYTDVGDEALLLAKHAPAWVARNRIEGAKRAAKAGAEVIIMDDGFQNPTLAKTYSVLLADPYNPEGNGRIFPAGPLREPFADAKARADSTVMIYPMAQADATPTEAELSAWLTPRSKVEPGRVFAFCGIARPQRFFEALNILGYDIVEKAAFADHYPFREAEITSLLKRARKKNLRLITTEKDLMRIHPSHRNSVDILAMEMKISDEENFLAPLLGAISNHNAEEL